MVQAVSVVHCKTPTGNVKLQTSSVSQRLLCLLYLTLSVAAAMAAPLYGMLCCLSGKSVRDDLVADTRRLCMIWITGSTGPQLFASSARQRFPMESHLCRDLCLGISCLFPQISTRYACSAQPRAGGARCL